MDLRFSDEQLLLQETVRGFVDRHAPSDQIALWFREKATFQPELYRRAAQAGWMGMMLPHELGGGSAQSMDCAVVFEQLGRGPVPGPFFASGVLAPLVLWEAASVEQRVRLIPPLCQGTEICAVALSDDVHRWDLETVGVTATADGDGYILNGRKPFVHDVDGATWVLCTARTPDGVVLAMVPTGHEGVRVRAHEGFLSSLFEVELESVRVARDDVIAGHGHEVLDAIERAIERALPVLASFQVGGCQRVSELTFDYTSERVVFGQPIGRFQRVQDHCVELVNHLDTARWITYETLWKVDSGSPATAAVHETKAVASEAYYQVCNSAHKVFAGPGTALDHALVPHTVTSRTLYPYLGNPSYHKDRMIRVMFHVQ